MRLDPLHETCVRPAPKSRLVVSGLSRVKIKSKSKARHRSRSGPAYRRWGLCDRCRRQAGLLREGVEFLSANLTDATGCDFGRPSGGIAEWAERHGCRESRIGPWMARLRRAHGAMPERGNPDEGGAGQWSEMVWLLCRNKVTRRSRNRSGVSQNDSVSQAPHYLKKRRAKKTAPPGCRSLTHTMPISYAVFPLRTGCSPADRRGSSGLRRPALE
jgi:hypothetical protein